MVRHEGASHYTPIAWEDAFRLVGSTLRTLDHPDQAIFYTSGRTSNEAAFLYQLFVRAFGTNNLPDCSNMCHESTSVALAEVDRHRQGERDPRGRPRRRADPDRRPEPRDQPPPHAQRAGEGEASAGPRSSPSTRSPRPASRGSATPRRRVGCPGSGPRSRTCTCRSGYAATSRSSRRSVLSWSPRTPPGRRTSRPGVHRPQHTTGFDAWADHMRALDWDAVDAATGLPAPRSSEAADLFAASTRTVICWAMGITQHRNAVATIKEIANVASRRATSASPAPDSAPCAATRTSRVTGRWGSGRRCPATSSTRCGTSSASSRPASTGSTPSTRCARSATARRGSSSGWAATSRLPLPTPRSSRRRCAVPT